MAGKNKAVHSGCESGQEAGDSGDRGRTLTREGCPAGLPGEDGVCAGLDELRIGHEAERQAELRWKKMAHSWEMAGGWGLGTWHACK